MKRPQKTGVIFDLDGVILNDEHLHKTATASVLGEYGLELTDSIYEEICLGRPDTEAFPIIRERFYENLKSVSSNLLLDMKARKFLELSDRNDISYSGAIEVINDLSKCFVLAIVTSSARIEAATILKRLQIDLLFEAVICSDDVKKGKPDPEAYLLGLKAMHLQKHKVVAIEDSPSGVQSAKAAGLRCIAVLQTTSRKRLQHADFIVNGISDVNYSLIDKVISG